MAIALKPYNQSMSDRARQVAEITAQLQRHSQRATYGAVAGVVGTSARSVMQGFDRNQRNSFVVSKETKLPTHYAAHEMHPNLTGLEHLISDADELKTWLANHK